MIVTLPSNDFKSVADSGEFQFDEFADVRMDKVARIRHLIKQGQYETQERLDGALGGLLADLLSDTEKA